ncbi:MAG: hypothetical protein GY869_17465 [Planctomycetes bacterium]|nr:hypothetical protein [Planctomycetota bacterium]
MTNSKHDKQNQAHWNKDSLGYRVIIASLWVLTILALGSGCQDQTDRTDNEIAYEIEKEYERGPLTVHLKVDKAQVSIADTINMRLEALIDPGYELDIPSLGEALGEYQLGILDYRSFPDKLVEDERLLLSREYRLEPIVSGTYAIPALKFDFREIEPTAGSQAEDKQYQLETEPIDIEVTSLLDDQRSDLAIADIKDVASMPKSPGRWWIWTGGAVGAAGLMLGLLLLLRRRKVKEIRIMMTAHQVAYSRLEKLVADDLVAAGQVKEFYERISNILRWYIEHRFNLKAPERTTEEFLQEVHGAGVLNHDQQKMLSEFLQHCDMVKFAMYGPSAEEIQKTFDLTKEFIESTKVLEKQVDVTEQQTQAVEAIMRSA